MLTWQFTRFNHVVRYTLGDTNWHLLNTALSPDAGTALVLPDSPGVPVYMTVRTAAAGADGGSCELFPSQSASAPSNSVRGYLISGQGQAFTFPYTPPLYVRLNTATDTLVIWVGWS